MVLGLGGLGRLVGPRGATVLDAGEPASALVIVLRGAVETDIRRGGLAARARLAGPGRIVGHLVLLEGAQPATSVARERSILLEVPLERVREIIDRGDDAGLRFGFGVYADIVDALFEAQRPISRMAALASPAS
jgi:CRP-like cAMP-binding protein